MEKIALVYLSIMPDGKQLVRCEVRMYDCKKKKKVFEVFKQDEFGISRSYINQEKLNTIQSKIREDCISFIAYCIWCNPKDVDQNKKVLIDHCSKEVQRRVDAIQKMATGLNEFIKNNV